MEKLLAIVTEDAVYGRALGDYMTGTQLIDYSVRTFYSVSDYLMFRDENVVSVLLADENSLKMRWLRETMKMASFYDCLISLMKNL